MAENPIRSYGEGEQIPQVDAEDIKRTWHLKPPLTAEGERAACSPGADIAAVFLRLYMIDTLNTFKLLTPWQHGEELDDAVFRIAATFPLHVVAHRSYKTEGDEIHGFDPNAFVQRLMEETGISHTWEPVAVRVPEGAFMGHWTRVQFADQGANPDREAKHQARALLWEIWKRFAPSLEDVVSHSDKESATKLVATFFADFLMENIELVRDVEEGFRTGFPPVKTLKELEKKAQGLVWGTVFS